MKMVTIAKITSGAPVRFFVGVDAALQNTGVCLLREGVCVALTTIHSDLRGGARLAHLADTLTEFLRKHLVDASATLYAALEGYAYGRTQGASGHGEACGVVRLTLHRLNADVQTPAPACLKKYLTGTGGADKARMIACARRLEPTKHIEDDHQADALGLAYMARVRAIYDGRALPAWDTGTRDEQLRMLCRTPATAAVRRRPARGGVV